MTAPPTALAAQPKPDGVRFETVWRGVRRYSLVLALFAAGAAAAGAGVWAFLPLPKMTGHVVYHIAALQPYVLQQVNDPRADLGYYRQYQQAALKRRVLATAALADPAAANTSFGRVTPDADAALSKALRVEFPSAEIMRVSLDGDNGDELVAVLRAVHQVYTRDVVNKDRNWRLARHDQLKRQMDAYADKAKEQNARMRQSLEQVGGVGDHAALGIRQQSIEQQLGAAQQTLTTIQSSLLETELRTRLAGAPQQAAGVQVPDQILDGLVQQDPRFQQLQKARAAAVAHYEQFKARSAPGSRLPGLVAAEAKLAQVDKELAALPAEIKPELAKWYKEEVARTTREQLEGLKGQVGWLKEYEKELTKRMDKLVADRKALTAGAVDLSALKQEEDANQRLRERFAVEFENMKPELDVPARVTLFEEPAASPGDEGNKRLKFTGLAAGAVLLLGLVTVTGLEHRNRRLQSPAEVSRGLGLPVVGAVPLVKGDTAHVLAEAVDTTRTLFLSAAARAGKPTRTVLVTSATSGEGKTSLSSHLAVSLARTGLRVLLVDADMRRPAVHRVLGLGVSPGLADVLCGDADLAAAVRPSRVPGLDVLPAGEWRPEAAAGLSGPTWEAILRAPADGYDFVLIDSPPVLPVADALAIARKADGVLVAVMRDVSKFAAVETACHRLSMAGANLLGVVMSGLPASQSYYYADGRYVRPAAEPAAAQAS